MVMIKILVNNNYVIPKFGDNRWINIYRNDVIEIETMSIGNKEYEIAITIDGLNLFDGKQNIIYESKRELVKEGKLFYQWHTGENIKFTQLKSNYSITNNGDPNMRGVIGIAIFENKELTQLQNIYYTDMNKLPNKLPKAFKE